MSKRTENYRKINIVNAHDFAGAKGAVYLFWYPREGGRSVRPPMCFVYRIGYKTDPHGHWSHYGNKAFVGDKVDATEAAKAWASERYGIAEWARTPFGSWQEASTVKDRIKELDELVKRHEQDAT